MYIFVLLALVGSAWTVPVHQVDSVKFLVDYGYLADGEAGRTAGSVSQAVCDFQDFVGLEMTCVMDDATLEKMAARRCGVSDVMSESARYVLVGTKWETSNINWKRLNYNNDIYHVEVEKILADALQVWADVTPLTFTNVGYHDEAEIEISFLTGYHGDGFPFDGPGGQLAHAFFPGTGIGGDTHFDDDETFTTGTDPSQDGVNLFAVAAHEFGHALGLQHSNDQNALMAPYYNIALMQNLPFSLPYDDVAGIQRLYGYVV